MYAIYRGYQSDGAGGNGDYMSFKHFKTEAGQLIAMGICLYCPYPEDSDKVNKQTLDKTRKQGYTYREERRIK